jgi:predicted nucleic acid-binding protein
VILLDTIVLSNFARIERLDLLRLALPDAATTPQVVTELERGVALGFL